MRVSLPALLFMGALAVSTAAAAQIANNASGSSNGGNTMSNPNNARSGKAAAGGNDNQAVATTSMSASQPAHGSNSFTRGEARDRISNHGFQNVTALHLNSHGVWWGKAMKDGQSVKVWLDYKGNVGQS